ncbi:MAG: periplasmic binding protein/LacI transcriptional regulator, partial [Mycobacterium sp.]|nr:periplasmic binding protein/LacI transcriptional regulator [Mycobacterium sp.]
MRKSTHLGVVAAALTIATGLAACGSSGGKTSSDGDFTISAANYTESAALFRVIHTNLDKVIESKKTGVAVKWYDNAGDPAKMTQNARLMVQDKPDAIVMYPVSNTTQGVGKIIGDSKIPCVSVNL